jgi:hypothetical protein
LIGIVVLGHLKTGKSMPSWAYLGIAAGIFIAFIPFLINRNSTIDPAPKQTTTNKTSNAPVDARLDPISSKSGVD